MLKNFLKTKYLERKLKKLSRTAFERKSDDFTIYNEEGNLSYGRLDMLSTLKYSLEYVYYNKTKLPFFYLGITALQFQENKHCITIDISHPSRLIGKGGQDYNVLRDVLERVFDKAVSIQLHESKTLYGFNFIEEF